MSPFRYRPKGEGDLDWEDNWLSNFFAWYSDTFMSTWCKEEPHWTLKFFNYLWAECGCCLFFRGLTIGFFLGQLTVLAAVVVAMTMF